MDDLADMAAMFMQFSFGYSGSRVTVPLAEEERTGEKNNAFLPSPGSVLQTKEWTGRRILCSAL